MKIGVFDSGVGGLSVANAIKKELPEYEVSIREDKQNLPYGTKSPEQLLELVIPLLQAMVDDGCGIIVIACNTVTTNIIFELRQRISVPLLGMEPMVKPAADLTKSGIIAVFATNATLRSRRYAWLKREYAAGITVVEPDCSRWAEMIQNNQINRQEIDANVAEALSAGADVLVLGCTHYHWIEAEIKAAANDKVQILQPERSVIDRLQKVLKQQQLA